MHRCTRSTYQQHGKEGIILSEHLDTEKGDLLSLKFRTRAILLFQWSLPM